MATPPIRFGIQTGQQTVEWAQLLALWQKADAWGYDSLWNFDHFYPIFVDPEGPCLESWTTLAALAQATKRARIGTLVNGNTYRHPCVTAKMAAPLDPVSGGRLNFGIGAGWFELEHRAFGIDFKTVPERLRALDEACRIIKGMFTDEKVLLKIVAEHADMWNTGAQAERMKHLIAVIDRHGETVGRDTSTIEKTV